jgi:hypothetical protein
MYWLVYIAYFFIWYFDLVINFIDERKLTMSKDCTWCKLPRDLKKNHNCKLCKCNKCKDGSTKCNLGLNCPLEKSNVIPANSKEEGG